MDGKKRERYFFFFLSYVSFFLLFIFFSRGSSKSVSCSKRVTPRAEWELDERKCTRGLLPFEIFTRQNKIKLKLTSNYAYVTPRNVLPLHQPSSRLIRNECTYIFIFFRSFRTSAFPTQKKPVSYLVVTLNVITFHYFVTLPCLSLFSSLEPMQLILKIFFARSN